MYTHFHLFVYGSLLSGGSASSLMSQCELVCAGEVGGVLYDIDGEYRALVLYGKEAVRGEVWRCPSDTLASLDTYEGVNEGLFRRVGVTVNDIGCWTYVAGPRLTKKLTQDRRIVN